MGNNCVTNKNVVYPTSMDGPPPEDCELVLTLDEPKPQPKGKVQLRVVQVKNPAFMSLRVCIQPVEKQFGPSFFDGREKPATGGSGNINYSQIPSLPKGKILRSRGGVLINGNTGEVMLGMSERKMLRPASLTKVMTAKLVLDLAKKHGEGMLDEVAECPLGMYTKGTSANLNYGDSISVRSLLHGLMLPSGNDAGYTLAVHCGPKCEEYKTMDATKYAGDMSLMAYDAFVKAMNNEAKRLKLKQTRFENPHGARGRYTKKRHMSSAYDMAVLTREALLKHPMINEMMMTIRFTCMVMSRHGEKQQKTWYNTHGLLGRSGVHGGKTGVTHKGHYCLATQVRHGDHLLIAVVLECKNKRDCYADTQRLLNYGWRKLGVFDADGPNDTALGQQAEGGGGGRRLVSRPLSAEDFFADGAGLKVETGGLVLREPDSICADRDYRENYEGDRVSSGKKKEKVASSNGRGSSKGRPSFVRAVRKKGGADDVPSSPSSPFKAPGTRKMMSSDKNGKNNFGEGSSTKRPSSAPTNRRSGDTSRGSVSGRRSPMTGKPVVLATRV